MKFTGKEKWLYYLAVLKTSQTGKILTLEQKQIISDFIRKKICPEIGYDEWFEMEKEMIKLKTEIMNLMYEGMQSSISGKISEEAKKMFNESDLIKLDESMKESLSSLDFEKLQVVFNMLPEKERKDLEPVFKQVKKMSEDYKKEKKNG